MANINPNTTTYNKYVLMFSRMPHVEYFCRRVSLPDVNLGSAEQFTPIVNIPRPGEKVDFGMMNIEFALDENWNGYVEIFKWITGIGNIECGSRDIQEALGLESNATLGILSNHNNITRMVNLYNCWPTNLSSITLDTEIQDPMEIKVNASFRLSHMSFGDVGSF